MIKYNIQADIIDIQTDNPKQTDKFLIDTNVLYWLTYTRASISAKPPSPQQGKDYPDYIKKALAIKSGLLRTELHLTELGYLIETSELSIFNYSFPDIKRKEFRHNFTADYTKTVITELSASWGQIKTITSTLEAKICELTGDAILARCKSQKADTCDLFTLEIMSKAGINKIITDDGDFSTIPGIQVFTSNRNVISRAGTQKKLTRR
jgi:hypothetical protein